MEHLASIHGERIQCELCDFQAYPYDRVARHQIMKHNFCSPCGEKYGSQKELELHSNVVHGKKFPNDLTSNFSCDFCDYEGNLLSTFLSSMIFVQLFAIN